MGCSILQASLALIVPPHFYLVIYIAVCFVVLHVVRVCPPIHQLAQAAQNIPVRLLKRQNGDDDDDDGGDGMDDIISGVSIAAMVVIIKDVKQTLVSK